MPPLINLFSNRIIRLLLVVFAAGLCLWTIRTAGVFGVERLLVRYALGKRDLGAAEKAIQLAPNDAQSHFAGAAVLSTLHRPAESAAELEQAIALRPADYSLWLQLGLLRDQLGQTEAALAAFDEAVRLAPFYAGPRWQRGNLMLRAGRYDAAFKDLSQAAQSNPELLPGLIDLAWNLSKGDPNLTAQWTAIKTDQGRMVFAKFLASHGRPKEAVARLRAIGVVPDEINRELVGQLIAKGDFQEAYEIWKGSSDKENSEAAGQFYDGGFEGPLTFDAIGFGWRLPRNISGVTVSLNSTQPHSGSKNLRIDFAGDSNPGSELVSQLLLVEPLKKYQVNFAGRSQEVVSGGLPVIVVTDAKGDRKRLGQSKPLAQGTANWQVSSFEFTAGATTNAIIVSLQRENCSTSPCPIFGAISLDSFSMVELK